MERAVVPRRRPSPSIRRASSPRPRASPTSTCCACRRSPTISRDPELGGSAGEDQFAVLAALLPGFTAIPGVAVDQPGRDGRRRRFGNMIFSRLPVRQVYRHLAALSLRSAAWPACRASRSRPSSARRSATCASSRRTSSTTPARSAMAQVDGAAPDLRRRPRARARRRRSRRTTAARSRRSCGRGRRSSPAISISSPTGPSIRGCWRRSTTPTPPLRDAWQLAHPGAPHPSTFCIYQKTDPSGAELHCDFIFVNDDLAPRVRAIAVDQQTQASDHQPVILTLG